ncbi:MAG TPA: T9SS type A sorting domain-containing protein [Candidatus Kapabacteria bacterium]|nr:T9SS type A sorting domain-containing protein [Candidatus Kapabacteria bacterium]
MKPWITIALLVWGIALPVRAQMKAPMVVVSYNALTQYGRNNRDSVVMALHRLGVAFDSVDRNQNDTMDYTPWQILIWSSGDPTVPVVAGEATGQAGLSAKEIGEVEQFLKAGIPYCQKKLVMAGQNIAYQHGSLMPNGPDIDTTFLQHWLHVRFVANTPAIGGYHGLILGDQPAYWKFPDSINSASPNVVRPALHTAQVGPEVNETAYSYHKHPATPRDSGAGVSYNNNSINTVFYAFDWADAIQTSPGGEGDTTSGTTRVLVAAFAFFVGHGGILPCSSSDVSQPSSEPDFIISEIYPNPAQTQAEIRFSLPAATNVTVRLIDPLGKTVLTKYSGTLTEGSGNMTLDLRGIPNGIYLCQMEAMDVDGDAMFNSRKLSILR